jgi:hydrogenase maturation factor
MSHSTPLPLGKLPPDLLARILSRAPVSDPRVLLGPGVGLDCAVIDLGERLLVLKSDPITFATQEIGWYAVQISSNDIATTGAEPRWLLSTLLLPEGQTTPELVETIGDQLFRACQEMGISVVGGHTEVTYALPRPVLVATLIGEARRDELVTPRGAQPGDRLLLTKGVPIEAVAVLAREFPGRLEGLLAPEEVRQAQDFLYQPGISVYREARLACRAGRVSAMHDPTEGGLAGALWEMSEACGRALDFEPSAVYIPPLAQKVCRVFDLDPLACIASGALLLCAAPREAAAILRALHAEGIQASEIGAVGTEPGPAVRLPGGETLPRPGRDEIARVFEAPGAWQ